MDIGALGCLDDLLPLSTGLSGGVIVEVLSGQKINVLLSLPDLASAAL